MRNFPRIINNTIIINNHNNRIKKNTRMNKIINGLFNINGRFNGMQFGAYNILNLSFTVILLSLILYIININNTGIDIIAAILLIIVIIGSTFSTYAIMSKRFHDLGHTGLYSFCIYVINAIAVSISKFVPKISLSLYIITFVILTFLICKSGEKNVNQYGAPNQ